MSNPDNSAQLTRLPHTGLQVPTRPRLEVTSSKTLATADGEAFTATLRLDGKIVGTVENSGHGGPTQFEPNNWRTFNRVHVEAYAARCRNADGEPASDEYVLDELVTEYQIGRSVKRAAAQGMTVVRGMEFLASDGVPTGEPFLAVDLTCRVPESDTQKIALATHIQQMYGRHLSENGFWQLWTGEQWEDLTPRPTVAATA